MGGSCERWQRGGACRAAGACLLACIAGRPARFPRLYCLARAGWQLHPRDGPAPPLRMPLGSQLLPAGAPLLLVHLASLPHPIRLQIAERASSALQPDIASLTSQLLCRRLEKIIITAFTAGLFFYEHIIGDVPRGCPSFFGGSHGAVVL
jgi:hypothetical protein